MSHRPSRFSTVIASAGRFGDIARRGQSVHVHRRLLSRHLFLASAPRAAVPAWSWTSG
jgi:hypothetical protein